MSRVIPTGAAVLAVAACGYGAGDAVREAVPYVTAEGVTYSIYPWRYSNACRPGGPLELTFQCYNLSEEPVGAATVFEASRLFLVRPDGEATEAESSAFGTGGTPSVILPQKSYGRRLDLGALWGLDKCGDYVVRWEVAGGVAAFPIRVLEGPEYYAYRLATDICYNEWGLHMYGEDGLLGSGLGREAVALGEAMVPGLRDRLDDRREGFIEGSEDATIGAMYGWRVCDYAAIMLVEVWGEEAGDLRSRDPAARDRRMEELRAKTGD